MNKEKSTLTTILKDVLFDLLGGSAYSAGIVCFLSPAQIAPGGISGISVILNHLFGAPIGTVTLLLNLPLLLLAWRFLGRVFALKTLKSVLIQAVITDAFSVFMPVYQGDFILAAVFGGVCMGTGLALIFMRGSTTGGTDIISRLIQLRYRHISIGRLILQVDMVVVAASMLVFKNIEVGLYAMMTIFTSTKIVDSVLFGLYTGKLVLIVSGKNREICREITEKLGRGATFLRGEGGYSGEEKQVLLCAIRPPEYHRMQEIVRKIDPDGFVITVQASEILGQGFSPIREESVK